MYIFKRKLANCKLMSKNHRKRYYEIKEIDGIIESDEIQY